MKLNNQKGAVLVETAIILPILLLIVFGIFEFGRAMFIVNTLNNAAREGARRAAVSPTNAGIDAYVKSCIPLDPAKLTVSTTAFPAAGSGAPVTVSVTFTFRTLTEMIPLLDGRILRGVATMRYEL